MEGDSRESTNKSTGVPLVVRDGKDMKDQSPKKPQQTVSAAPDMEDSAMMTISMSLRMKLFLAGTILGAVVICLYTVLFERNRHNIQGSSIVNKGSAFLEENNSVQHTLVLGISNLGGQLFYPISSLILLFVCCIVSYKTCAKFQWKHFADPDDSYSFGHEFLTLAAYWNLGIFVGTSWAVLAVQLVREESSMNWMCFVNFLSSGMYTAALWKSSTSVVQDSGAEEDEADIFHGDTNNDSAPFSSLHNGAIV